MTTEPARAAEPSCAPLLAAALDLAAAWVVHLRDDQRLPWREVGVRLAIPQDDEEFLLRGLYIRGGGATVGVRSGKTSPRRGTP